MKTETLIKQLEAKGYVYPSCLQWTTEDVDLRLNSMGQKDNVRFMSDTDKRILLDCFFERIEDDLMEYINIKLEDFLESQLTLTPSQEPF